MKYVFSASLLPAGSTKGEMEPQWLPITRVEDLDNKGLNRGNEVAN